jgi:S-adenosylmethionine decarboxylase
MNAGTEWLVDAEGCSAELLRDPDVLRSLCEEVITTLDLRVVGDPAWHRFPPPGGVTGMYLLSESHLTCHTFPETGLATFNFFCCRPRPPFPWEQKLQELLRADKVVLRTVVRGTETRNLDLHEARGRASLISQISELTSTREVSGL